MYNLQKIYIDDIPVLILHKKGTNKKVLPVIFVFHKLLENKSSALPIAFELAEHNYFVVIIDMVAHGDRKLEKRKLEYNFSYLFGDIYNTAKDVEIVIEYLRKKYASRLDFTNMTAVGISIGASIALVSSCIISSITRVACVIGSVNWEFMINHKMLNAFSIFYPKNSVLDLDMLDCDRKKYEPFIELKSNNIPSIIFINGLLDNYLLLQASRSYYNKILEIYNCFGEQEKLTYVELKKTGHEINDVVIEQLLYWLLMDDTMV